MIGNATAQSSIIPTSELMNGSTFSGSTSFNGYTYHTTVNYVSGLLQNASVGINHYASVGVNGSNAIDGLVAVMTVKITGKPSSTGRYASLPQLERWHGRSISIFVSIAGERLTEFIGSAGRSHGPLTVYWMPLVFACLVIVSSL